jgi:hypothetical protein
VSMRVLIQVEGILTLVVNCDLINNKNWTVIKFGTRIANVLCHLSVKYYMVLVLLNVIFSVELKNTGFHT